MKCTERDNTQCNACDASKQAETRRSKERNAPSKGTSEMKMGKVPNTKHVVK